MLDRLANQLVERRTFITAIMVALAAACAFLIPRVGVITDMAEYLPESSSMRQGLAILEEEFPDDEQTKTIRVMFTGLENADTQSQIYEQLRALPYVSHVSYSTTSPDYHSGEHTLYILHTTFDYGSPQEQTIKAELNSQFSDRQMIYRDDNPSPTSELPLWIIIIAVLLLMLILFAMCASWLEPIVFLVAIATAILLNLGTNIIRGSIADTTFAIGAILQLVLSMDYSIIVANAYRQERAKAQSTTDAMKHALRQAFAPVLSASFTTVVGLAMLCLMSVQIGMDLGIALAKGVFLSMLCVFTVLPTLILICDKWIQRTSKPYLHVNMKHLAGFEYRFRWFITAAFVVILVVSGIFGSRTPVAYTLSKEDPIADVFPKENTMVLLYRNSNESQAAQLANTLVKNPGVRSVSSYSSTLGLPRTLDNMEQVVNRAQGAERIDEAIVRLVYYIAHQGRGVDTMKAGDFLTFLKEQTSTNPMFSRSLTQSTQDGIRSLTSFADPDELTQPRGEAELARTLQIPQTQVKNVLLAWAIANEQVDAGTLSLPIFMSFLKQDVARDARYASFLDDDVRTQLNTAANLTDVAKMTRGASIQRTAQYLGIDAEQIAWAYMYYQGLHGAYDSTTMSIEDFANRLMPEVMQEPNFSEAIDENMRTQMTQFAFLTNSAQLNTPMDAQTIASVFALNPMHVRQIFGAYAQSQGHNPQTLTHMTPAVFIRFLDDLLSASSSSPISGAQGSMPEVSPKQRQELHMARTLTDLALSQRQLTPAEIAQVTGMDPSTVKVLFAYDHFEEDSDFWRISPLKFVQFLVENPTMREHMGERVGEVEQAQSMIEASVNARTFTSAEMAEFLGMQPSHTRALFLLYASRYMDTSSWQLSVQNFLHVLTDQVMTSPEASGEFTQAEAVKIRALRALVDSVVARNEYSPEAMTALLAPLGDVNVSTVSLLYLLRGVDTQFDKTWTLSIVDFFDTLTSKVFTDPRLAGFIDAQERSQVAEIHDRIVDQLAKLVGPSWSRLVVTTVLPEESHETTSFIQGILDTCAAEFGGECHLVGQSAMVYEIAKDFTAENLLITILTALAIFLVIALTFRSITVPALLVLLVQCGVFITITVIGMQGYDSYFLAQLMVQCILMGATIDYGILYTSYYRKCRETMGIADALKASYDGSLHTIATSGSIMIIVTGILGFLFDNPTIGQICRTISIGALAASILILLVLPGMLASFDRFVGGPRRLRSLH